ncbi:hypothetical protein ACHAXA_010040 [Cyclostephanos tholiformis]|uniref:Uncharacterized protein n=1 Tax=Cyclostephanos tholiformis TaxID=382380 RepID=A0ABD3RGR5_9STRA
MYPGPPPLPIPGGGMPRPIPPPPMGGGGMPPPIIMPGGIGGGGGGIMPPPIMPPPPTPCTGAAPNPIGAPIPPPTPNGGGTWDGGMGRLPLPTPRATPGPPTPPVADLDDGGGGPSTATLTTFSPLSMINPRLRFSTRSSMIADPPPLFVEDFLALRYSSASTNTRFRCLSNARKVPTTVRPSARETRSRCSMYRRSLDPLPVGILGGFQCRVISKKLCDREVTIINNTRGSANNI